MMGGRNGKLFGGYRVLVLQDESVLESQRGDNVNILNITELYTLKWLR